MLSSESHFVFHLLNKSLAADRDRLRPPTASSRYICARSQLRPIQDEGGQVSGFRIALLPSFFSRSMKRLGLVDADSIRQDIKRLAAKKGTGYFSFCGISSTCLEEGQSEFPLCENHGLLYYFGERFTATTKATDKNS
jgi:hypothetical protein